MTGIIRDAGSEEGVVRTDIEAVKTKVHGFMDNSHDANYALRIFTDDLLASARATAVSSIIDGTGAGLVELLRPMKTSQFGRDLVEPHLRLYAAVENLAREVNFQGNLAEILTTATRASYDLRSEDPFTSIASLGLVADGAKALIGDLNSRITSLDGDLARLRASTASAGVDVADARAETARVRAELDLYKGFAEPFYADLVTIAKAFGWYHTGAAADRIKAAQTRDTFAARKETPVVLSADVSATDVNKLAKADDISLIVLAQNVTKRNALFALLNTVEGKLFAGAHLDLAAKYGGVVQEFEDLVK